MKKNKMMRVASALLIAVLLTTSAISGTFAKYVTQDSGADSARVAKFGVVLDVDGHLFDVNYVNVANNNKHMDDASSSIITVESYTKQDKLVAPGTKNDVGMTFSIKGTPEVAVAVAMDLKAGSESAAAADPIDIYLKQGTYRDWTVSGQNTNYDQTYTQADVVGVNTSSTDKKYYPVVFTLKEKMGNDATASIFAAANTLSATNMSNRWSVKNNEGGFDTVITGTLKDIDTLFGTLTNGMTKCGANGNYVFDNTFTLTWAWDFEQTSYNANCDKADTLLGNLEAGTVDLIGDNNTINVVNQSKYVEGQPGFSDLTAGTDYCLNTGFYFTISVTQVD